MAEPHYDEDEIRALMERAAQLQAQSEGRPAPGLTMAELRQVAADAGIDPAHLATAAAELAHRREAVSERESTFMGAPVVVERTRLAPGSVSDETWLAMVRELRRRFHDDGVAGEIGGVREWTFVGRGLRRDIATRFTLEPDGAGNTRLVLRQSVRELAKGLTIAGSIQAFMAVLFTTLALVGVDPEMWAAAAITATLALAFGGGVQIGMRLWESAQQDRLDRALDRLDVLVRDATTAESSPEAGARLDLDARPDLGSVTSSQRPLRRPERS